MKVGIMGCGGIAEKMAKTMAEVKETCAFAVASRSYEKAKAFAEKFGFEKAYGSYEELVNDKEVELIYVATPHSHHYSCVKLCLEAGKNVLCEKAFTVNAAQARELISIAKEKNLLLAEAIWTRYMPSRKIIDDILESGIIGKPMTTMANLHYNIAHVERITKPELAGGALLDLGVYMLNYARMIFKAPIKKLVGTAIQNENMVDMVDNLTVYFEDGTCAQLQSGAQVISNRRGSIFGTEGYVEIENVNNPEKIEVYNSNYELVKSYEIPEQITGFEYELMACVNAIKNGKTECSEMPHEEIIYIMELMDSLRKEWNYQIPEKY